MPASWDSISTLGATGAMPLNLACRCGPTPLESISLPVVLLIGVTWMCAGLRKATSEHGPRQQRCEHCGYDLAGVPFPGTCPECGNHARGIAARTETLLAARGCFWESFLLAGATTLLMWGVFTQGVLQTCVLAYRHLAWKFASSHAPRVGEASPGIPLLLAFISAFLIALPLSPGNDWHSARRIVLRTGAWLCAGLVAALAKEWTDADYVDWDILMTRVTIWSCGLSMLLRARTAYCERSAAHASTMTPASSDPG